MRKIIQNKKSWLPKKYFRIESNDIKHTKRHILDYVLKTSILPRGEGYRGIRDPDMREVTRDFEHIPEGVLIKSFDGEVTYHELYHFNRFKDIREKLKIKEVSRIKIPGSRTQYQYPTDLLSY